MYIYCVRDLLLRGQGPSKAWKETCNAERPANACEETCERMQRDLRKRPTQENYNAKRPANAFEETCSRMQRDVLAHLDKAR